MKTPSFKKEVEEKLKKLMMLAAMLALVLAAAAPAVMAQGTGAPSAVIDNNGVAKANAGGTSAQAGCPTVPPEATAGGVVAKAPCKPAPPPPPPKVVTPPPKAAPPPPKAAAAPPKAAPPPPPPKALPKTGGLSPGAISLAGLGAGALLVGGGLLARRIVR